MIDSLWSVLFATVLLYDIYQEHQYIFIYYTIWTFTLETVFFILKACKREDEALIIYPFIFAPSIVVCCGFWLIIAPIFFTSGIPSNIVLILVTHGCNMIAMLQQPYKIRKSDLWKPIFYTFIYNIFLAVYVGAGFRSISGRLPYWYAEYDKWSGWVFACLGIVASGIIHLMFSVPQNKKSSKVYIV
jgi:hypothetical protein